MKSKIVAYRYESKGHHRRIIISTFYTRRNNSITIPTSPNICSNILRILRSIKITHIVKILSIIVNEDVLSTIYKLTCIGNFYIILRSPNTRTNRY